MVDTSQIIKWHYFQVNVPFSVGIRLFPRDPDGLVLNASNPYVNIREENLRDFKRANKDVLELGLIKEVEEPSTDFETANTITDEEATELVKNLFMLKKRLPDITSEAILGKLYAEAKKQKRSPKIIELIEERLMDVTPAGMQGIDWGAEERGE